MEYTTAGLALATLIGLWQVAQMSELSLGMALSILAAGAFIIAGLVIDFIKEFKK